MEMDSVSMDFVVGLPHT